MTEILIEAEGLVKTYGAGSRRLRILNGINLTVRRGECIAIMGTSGSGKSTLLNILGFMDRPDSGIYRFSGKDLSLTSERERSRLRSVCIGFVFQRFNLIDNLNVLENVEMPFIYAPAEKRRNRQHAMDAISRVGLRDRVHHRPAQLSGGEMQRVAIARALAMDPELLLADEPTGNLDALTSAGLLDLLAGLQESGKTLIMVTHDPRVAGYAQKQMILENGLLS